MKEVVKKEVLKPLKAEVIYPVSDIEWASPVQVVPMKGGMMIIRNEKNQLISQRSVTGWRMCIDYRKLNKATRKDHFLLPFTNEMLERLTNHSSFYYLEWREKSYHSAKLYKEKKSKDGMTSKSRPSNSSREVRYFSLTLVFIYLVMASFIVSGKVPT
jgi:hypothetical protein